MSDSKRIIVTYLNRLLGQPLHSLGMSDIGIRRVLEDVKFQMESLLHHWGDLEFRNAVLCPGMEEAEFYGPVSKGITRQFVVTTVRNSMFELATKQDYNQVGLKKPIEDRYIVRIMQEAVNFFDQIDFQALGKEISSREIERDVYLDASREYPVAFHALKSLGSSVSRQVDFTPCGEKVVGFDQFSLHFGQDSNLVYGVRATLSGEDEFFYADSFKSLTRKYSDLLYLLEVLLEHDKAIVTANYYLTNGYGEQRKRLLKPAHSQAEAMANMKNLKGIGERHRQAMAGMQEA